MKQLLISLICTIGFAITGCQPEYIEPAQSQPTLQVTIYVTGNARVYYGLGLITKSVAVQGEQLISLMAYKGLVLYIDSSDEVTVTVYVNNEMQEYIKRLTQETYIEL